MACTLYMCRHIIHCSVSVPRIRDSPKVHCSAPHSRYCSAGSERKEPHFYS